MFLQRPGRQDRILSRKPSLPKFHNLQLNGSRLHTSLPLPQELVHPPYSSRPYPQRKASGVWMAGPAMSATSLWALISGRDRERAGEYSKVYEQSIKGIMRHSHGDETATMVAMSLEGRTKNETSESRRGKGSHRSSKQKTVLPGNIIRSERALRGFAQRKNSSATD